MPYYRLERDGEVCWKQVDPFDRGDPAPEGALVVPDLPRDNQGNPLPNVVDWDGENWVLGDGTVHTEETLALRERKDRMLAAVKAKRDACEQAGCQTPYGPIDTNPDSQRKVGGGSTAALALGASFSKKWRMADNSYQVLDAAKMIEVGLLVVAHVDACQQRKNDLDEAIEEATTLAELDLIDIESGWPAL